MDPQQENLSLENDKLRLEIKDLNTSFLRRPANWFGFIAAVVALAGFFTQRELSRIQIAEAELEVERTELEAARKLTSADELQRLAEERAAEAERLQKEAEELLKTAQAEADSLSAQVNDLVETQAKAQAELAEVEERAVGLSSELADLEAQRRLAIQEVNEKKALLRDLQAQVQVLSQAAPPTATPTLRSIENNINRAIRDFNCGAGTKFYCP